MNLYDILACPTCKVAVIRHEQALECSQCHRVYPIVNNVPVLFPDSSVPVIQHEGELSVRTGYNPWIERVVMQSLPMNAIVLDLGAGNMAFNLPNVIRMDVTLTPYVDVVGDAHALPFLPGTFDFIFSLAVIEHLRQPFVAAQEMYDALRNGGYVYGESNFVYPYHGYPHHYFGTTQQGIESVFSTFMRLRTGVATYQMPSFAVRFVLESYKNYLGNDGTPEFQAFQELLQNVLDQPLGTYDSRFTEEAALRVAAGVFYFGVKSVAGTSDVIPPPVQAVWQQSLELQRRYPDWLNLGTADNLMLWAKHEGQQHDPEMAAYFAALSYFRKNDSVSDQDLDVFNTLPVEEPGFGYIPDAQRAQALPTRVRQLEVLLAEEASMHVDLLTAQQLQAKLQQKDRELERKNRHILYLEDLLRRIESGRVMRLLRLFK